MTADKALIIDWGNNQFDFIVHFDIEASITPKK